MVAPLVLKDTMVPTQRTCHAVLGTPRTVLDRLALVTMLLQTHLYPFGS
jgi:hypothetical protein